MSVGGVETKSTKKTALGHSCLRTSGLLNEFFTNSYLYVKLASFSLQRLNEDEFVLRRHGLTSRTFPIRRPPAPVTLKDPIKAL